MKAEHFIETATNAKLFFIFEFGFSCLFNDMIGKCKDLPFAVVIVEMIEV